MHGNLESIRRESLVRRNDRVSKSQRHERESLQNSAPQTGAREPLGPRCRPPVSRGVRKISACGAPLAKVSVLGTRSLRRAAENPARSGTLAAVTLIFVSR